MDLSLRAVRYFVTVAEVRHFGRAADRLLISQPALSQQIKRFEKQIGCQLLERSRRGVTLTASGRVFLDEARALLADGTDFGPAGNDTRQTAGFLLAHSAPESNVG